MAGDDDFTQPVPGMGTFSRLIRRTVQLGVDPDIFLPAVIQDVTTFYGLGPEWTLDASVVKKIRQDNGSGYWTVWYRVNGENPTYVSPMEAAGFTYAASRSALTKWYQDAAKTTLATGAEDEVIRGVNPTAGALWNDQIHVGADYKYGTGANPRAIDGKPVLYTETNSFTAGFDTDVDVATMMAGGKEFDLIMVCRRLTAGDNKSILQFGLNKPLNSRMYAGNICKAYGFITGYAETDNPNFTVAPHVLHYRFDNAAKELQLSIDGGAPTVVAETADWVTGDTGKFSLGLGNIAWAEWGVRIGLYGGIAALITALKGEYAIP